MATVVRLNAAQILAGELSGRVLLSDVTTREHNPVRNKLQCSLLRSRSGRSHTTLPVPTRLLQIDIHSFLGNKPEAAAWGRGALRDSRPSGCEGDQQQAGDKFSI